MHISEVKNNQFYQFPRWLLNEPYNSLSYKAMIMYALLWDRRGLSVKNNWHDKNGEIYVYFTNEQFIEKMNTTEPTVISGKKELAQMGLLKEVRQGLNKPNRLYIFGNKEALSSKPKKVLEPGTKKVLGQNQKKFKGINTEYINTEYINTEREIYSPVSDETRTTYLAEIKEAVSYLNSKAGTKYRHSAGKTQKLIRTRLKDGFTLNDIKKVIDKKADEWLKTDMSKYLRPETLFGSKFESYLNQPEPEKSEYDDLF